MTFRNSYQIRFLCVFCSKDLFISNLTILNFLLNCFARAGSFQPAPAESATLPVFVGPAPAPCYSRRAVTYFTPTTYLSYEVGGHL